MDVDEERPVFTARHWGARLGVVRTASRDVWKSLGHLPKRAVDRTRVTAGRQREPS
jgi:hypothetical protein